LGILDSAGEDALVLQYSVARAKDIFVPNSSANFTILSISSIFSAFIVVLTVTETSLGLF
jgi:hypothetical protein